MLPHLRCLSQPFCCAVEMKHGQDHVAILLGNRDDCLLRAYLRLKFLLKTIYQ